jgi:acetolactate synthase I/II/III large subunit
MEWMSGGEALVRSLAREGVKVVFGVPGVQLYGVLAALREEPGIRFIWTRHEQATSYMADGYARVTGDFGTALVVPGPGLLNATAGLSTAYSASSPVLMISGQIPKATIGKDIGLLHEVNDQLDAITPITKWRQRVVEIEDVPPTVREAVRQLRTGRPRPVEIEMPPETMEDEGEAELYTPERHGREAAPVADVERAAALLSAAKRPVIYAGGGVHSANAHAALRAVAEVLQAGVVTSPEGKGAVDDRSDLSLGTTLWPGSPLRQYVDGADVILVVGSRVAQAGFKPDQQIVQIDVDGDEVGRNYPNTVGLVGDARGTLELLREALGANGARPSQRAEREAVRAASLGANTTEPQASLLRSLREGAPEDTIFIAGMTQVGYYSRSYWPVYHPRSYITSSYSGNLGYEYPTALGAKVGAPDRPVIATVGDGGFLYNSQELATAVQFGINVVVVVFNDNAYGNVARDLDEAWGGSYGADLRNPDFVKLAEAYGAVGMRAEGASDLRRLVSDAVQLNQPVLIEVPVGRMPRPMFFAARRKPNKYTRTS